MKSLNEIGIETQTDKAAGIDHGHGYLDFYETFLSPYRNKEIKLLEIGVGGYEYPDRGGQSLRMWDKYFDHPFTLIAGVDKYPKYLSGLSQRVRTFAIDQTDSVELNNLVESMGGAPDIVVDDASHINGFSIQTFDIMFALLKPGGVYIWEDVHTSYWPNYGGDPVPMVSGTALHYLARLVYGLQADTMQAEFRERWDGHIKSMHFMRNTCVIIKREQKTP